ncbi:hypothetical protein DB30_06668 [Enhygromyxa salina]|uniref:Lipoprotein n=1 Tax=Enhygromyxa salina TaxID=215803 RepID=A0A0C1ZU75_9BACT|nr:hypothetical protein [Enhygromyxa salina]KIG14613.1 hypothetical protein DB30_06668 [Enhygromyxa salina]
MRTQLQFTSLIALCLTPSMFVGCADVSDVDDTLVVERDYPTLPDEGTPLAYAMLRVVNELDLEALDDDVPLDKRAATSIIEYRAGDDELLGTPDDRFIPNLAVLDSLYWMGAASLGRIQNYAILHAYVPDPLPATSCEPELEDAIAACLRSTENAAVPVPAQLQGQIGWGPFKADLLPSCLAASDVDYPSAHFFATAGAVGYLDPMLGYQSLLCELASEPVCALGVAGVAERSQPECDSFFSADPSLTELAVDPAVVADWTAQIAALESACNGECGYWVRVYTFEPGMAPTLLGDVMDDVVPTSPLQYGPYGVQGLSRGPSDQLPSVGAGAQALLIDVLEDLGLASESFDVGQAADEVPCPNCHQFLDSYVLLLRDAGVVIVLDREIFWDS